MLQKQKIAFLVLNDKRKCFLVYETIHKRLFDRNIRASRLRPGTGQNLASRTSSLSLYVKVYSKYQGYGLPFCRSFVLILLWTVYLT